MLVCVVSIAQTTMCIFSLRAKLAATYLDSTTSKLHIMEDLEDTEHFDTAQLGQNYLPGTKLFEASKAG